MEEYLEVEEQVVSILLRDVACVRKWLQGGSDKQPVGVEYFDSSHAMILAGIQYANNNDVSLTRQTYRDFLVTYYKLNPQESAAQISLYNRCLLKAGKQEDLPMLLEKVKATHIRRKTTRCFTEYKLEKDKLGDLGANRSLIEKLTSLEADTAESKSSFLEIHKGKDDFMKALMERRDNPQARLTCGIPEIDHTMNVGFKKGHLTLFCADVGAFKTTLMVNVALNMFHLHGENMLYVPLEMPAEEILQKVISRETEIPFNLIEHAEMLSKEQIEKIAEEIDKWNKLQHRFSILEMGGRAKLSWVRREIEKRINYFHPRVVFIDYADNLVPDRRQSRSDLEMNDILEDMRQMGKSLGFGVVSAGQLARDALKKVKDQKEGKENLSSTDIRGGQVMTANADTVYAQLRDPTQPGEKLILFCLKARHGSNIFPNKKDRTTLRVRGDIGLITSDNDVQSWGNSETNDEIIEGISHPPVDPDQPF